MAWIPMRKAAKLLGMSVEAIWYATRVGAFKSRKAVHLLTRNNSAGQGGGTTIYPQAIVEVDTNDVIVRANWYTTQELSDACGLTSSAIRYRIMGGKIPQAKQQGTVWYIPPSDAQRIIDECSKKGIFPWNP